MATIKSKNRRQLIPSVKQQSKERARRGERERDAGISTYSGWMWERNGALSLAAARMLLPPLKSLAARALQPIALRGAEAAGQTCRSCCCCGGGGGGGWLLRISAVIFVNHFITASQAPLTPCLLTKRADSQANPPLTGTKKAPPQHTHLPFHHRANTEGCASCSLMCCRQKELVLYK